MYSTVRPDKELAKQFVAQFAPEYLELFRDAQRAHGWQQLARALNEIRKRLKLDGYVALYDSEIRLYNCFTIGLLGLKQTKDLGAYLETLKPEDQRREVNELGQAIMEDEAFLAEAFPEDEAKVKLAVQRFEALPTGERVEVIKQAQFLWCAFIAFFYNTVSVMVHGEKLTSLVPKAMDGDEQSFLKAVHVDKALLHVHPRFKERHEEAMVNGDGEFLRNLGYRMAASPTKGPIRFPGLYLVFAMLESFGWLNELRHEEILDVCEAARLDRWQNRIEDLNAVTKQLGR